MLNNYIRSKNVQVLNGIKYNSNNWEKGKGHHITLIHCILYFYDYILYII